MYLIKHPKTLLILVVLSLTLWWGRWIFSYRYEPEYTADLYHTSQWQVPLSTRVMSDNELYQYAGEQLTVSSDLYVINPEVPPFGKVWYGLAIKLWGNPYLASVGWYLLAVVSFSWLSSLVFKSMDLRLTSLLLLIGSGLFFSQLSQTMLDLPQLVLLLLHLGCLIKVAQAKKTWQVVFGGAAAGLGLGLFAATKFPAFVPAMVVADLWLLWQIRKLKASLFLMAGVLVGNLLPAVPFILDYSVNEWLSGQKWMIAFYLSGSSRSILLNLWSVTTASLFGWYQGWWGDAGSHIVEWNVLWPLTIGVTGWQLRQTMIGRFQKKNQQQLVETYLLTVIVALLVSTIVIPFWPRYFLLILPIGVLLIVKQFATFPKLTWIIIGIVLCQAVLVWRAQPESRVKFALTDLVQGNYRQLYRHLTNTDRQTLNEAEWVQQLREFEWSLEQQDARVELTPIWVWPWQNYAQSQVTITRLTPMGKIRYQVPIKLIREQNVWRLNWSWSLVYPEFRPGDKFRLERSEQLPAPLLTTDRAIVIEYQQWPYLLLQTDQLQHSEALVNQLAAITHVPTVKLERLIRVTYQNSQIIPIDFLNRNDGQFIQRVLSEIPGAVIRMRPYPVFRTTTETEQRGR